MLFKSFYVLATFLALLINRTSASSETVTGPVTFLWPEQRVWYAAWQTNAPCGTNDATVGNRTAFPLDSGKVALVLAGETFNASIRMAYMNAPSMQSDFTKEIIHTISKVDAGHQCYNTPDSASSIKAGSNATVQLEYISMYNGSENETFYACADITFVEDADFTTSVSCFNVTVSDPSTEGNATSTTSSTSTPSSKTQSSAPSVSSPSDTAAGGGGFSTAAKAGIAVGSIIGGVAAFAAGAFGLMRKYKYQPTFRGKNEVERESWRLSTIGKDRFAQKSRGRDEYD